MKRSLLAWVTLGLLLLIAGGRVSQALRSGPASAPAAAVAPVSVRTAAGASRAGGRSAPAVAEPVLPAGSLGAAAGSTVERLARLAARQQLSRAGSGTYLDSLIVTTDSVVRRWPDRTGVPLKVAIVDGGPDSWRPAMADLVHTAFTTWQEAGVGPHFVIVADTADADITVRWIDRFGFDRAGQTDLTWDQLGIVHHAAISLAVHTNLGVLLPPSALLAVAVHEAGHAIGLPHSSDSADVMFPATRTGVLTERDRRTASLLYQLPPGPLRDAATPPQGQ